jgi:general secretion pathway protein H
MTHQQSPTGELGFTLLELLVVLAIMTLALAAAPALLSKARPGVAAQVAVQRLGNELRTARAAAVEQDREVDLILDVVSRAYATPDNRTVRLPDGLAWNIADGALAPSKKIVIAFYPDGSSSGGTIDFSFRDRTYRIVDHWLTGRVSIDE